MTTEEQVIKKVRCIYPVGPFEAGKVYDIYTRKGSSYYALSEAQFRDRIGWPHYHFEDVLEDLHETATEVPTKDAAPEAVQRPNHYARFKIEPIEFIMENDLEFWQGNVIKYTLRYDAKDGLQDLKKARRYLDMQIKKMEGDPKWAK